MNKNILIISPHFPPVNGADMHRVRHNVHYLGEFGWQATVICVDEQNVETSQDALLNISIPQSISVHKVKAFKSSWTRKLGLGALALRSLLFFFLKGNKILRSQKFDLVFFSTTQFPVLILGSYWKWRFGIPYMIDMQDPWHSEFYQDKPKNQRPPKYWFSYHLNKFLEPIAMHKVDGIISVSKGYADMLQERYPNIKQKNCVVIPFGAFEKDFEIASSINNSPFQQQPSEISMTYIGRGGADMSMALNIIFEGFKLGLTKDFSLFSKVKFYFLGTSYAKAGSGVKTIEPIAKNVGIESYVFEETDRMPYFESLKRLTMSDILLIPGSSDPNYTASKLYPYILAKKPILAVFSLTSSVLEVLTKTSAGNVITYNVHHLELEKCAELFYQILKQTLEKLPFEPPTNWKAFKPYTAKEMTKKQVDFFTKILENDEN